MTYLPLITILGPFGGDQLIVALTQFVPKLERRLDGIIRMATPWLSLDVARGGNRSMAHGSAAIYLNLTRELRTFLCRS